MSHGTTLDKRSLRGRFCRLSTLPPSTSLLGDLSRRRVHPCRPSRYLRQRSTTDVPPDPCPESRGPRPTSRCFGRGSGVPRSREEGPPRSGIKEGTTGALPGTVDGDVTTQIAKTCHVPSHNSWYEGRGPTLQTGHQDPLQRSYVSGNYPRVSTFP